jgi:hypothetical protein
MSNNKEKFLESLEITNIVKKANENKENQQKGKEKERLLTRKEMEFINHKLYTKIMKYKDSSCFNFLENYYDYYLKVLNSGKDDDIIDNYNNSMNNLKFFTFCYEKNENKNKNLY